MKGRRDVQDQSRPPSSRKLCRFAQGHLISDLHQITFRPIQFQQLDDMKRYLLSCAVNDLHEFRLPELDAIAHLYGFDISYPVAPDVTVSTPP